MVGQEDFMVRECCLSEVERWALLDEERSSPRMLSRKGAMERTYSCAGRGVNEAADALGNLARKSQARRARNDQVVSP